LPPTTRVAGPRSSAKLEVKATIRDSARGALGFAQGTLFVLIYLFPYLVVAGLILWAVVAVRRKERARRLALRHPVAPPAAAPVVPPESSPEVRSEDKEE